MKLPGFLQKEKPPEDLLGKLQLNPKLMAKIMSGEISLGEPHHQSTQKPVVEATPIPKQTPKKPQPEAPKPAQEPIKPQLKEPEIEEFTEYPQEVKKIPQIPVQKKPNWDFLKRVPTPVPKQVPKPIPKQEIEEPAVLPEVPWFPEDDIEIPEQIPVDGLGVIAHEINPSPAIPQAEPAKSRFSGLKNMFKRKPKPEPAKTHTPEKPQVPDQKVLSEKRIREMEMGFLSGSTMKKPAQKQPQPAGPTVVLESEVKPVDTPVKLQKVDRKKQKSDIKKLAPRIYGRAIRAVIAWHKKIPFVKVVGIYGYEYVCLSESREKALEQIVIIKQAYNFDSIIEHIEKWNEEEIWAIYSRRRLNTAGTYSGTPLQPILTERH